VIVYACLPARYSSTRFPGKVLAKDTGKFLIQHTYEQACKAKLPEKVIIAADDKRIAEAAKSFGAECIMTSRSCASGTDRIAQAILKIQNSKFKIRNSDVIINIQADEPEIDPANIDAVVRLLIETQNSKFKVQNCGMATLATEFQNATQIADPNIVKVVVSSHEPAKAICFSRASIPYDREKSGIGNIKQYLRHIGIYAYRKDFLLKFTKLPQSRLERIEKLEQLRAIENGFDMLVAKVKHTCDGIDTPEQYAEFVKRYMKAKTKIVICHSRESGNPVFSHRE
jgi:3-deoxy-manno-octulosonate cytidylyltransferase (CMP-KDO synthetase)